MRDVRFSVFGGPADTTRLEESPAPQPGPRQIRVSVHDRVNLSASAQGGCLFDGGLSRGMGLGEVQDVTAGDCVLEPITILANTEGATELAVLSRWTRMPGDLHAAEAETDCRGLDELPHGCGLVRGGQRLGLVQQGLQFWRHAEVHAALSCMVKAAEQHACAGPSAAGLILTFQLTQLRRIAEAEAALERFVVPGEQQHADTAASIMRANIRLAQGRYEEALKLATDGLGKLPRQGNRYIRSVGHVVMTAASLRMNDVRTALHYSRHLSEDALYGRLLLTGANAAWIAAQVVRVHRGAEEANSAMAAVVESAQYDNEVFLSQPTAAPVLTRFALDSGSTRAAERIVRQADAISRKNAEFGTLQVSATHAAGLLHGAPEDLRRATAEHADPWARALATEDLGLMLASRPDERAAGITSLERALEAYDEIGSLHDIARVKAQLRGMRVNRRRSSSEHQKRTPAGSYSLTATEREVATLVSQGLTNSQVANQIYLSRHTVAYHLKSIFGKLDVSSRGELTSLLVRLAEQDD